MSILLLFLTSGIFFIFTFIVQTLGAKLFFLLISFLLFKWGTNQIQLVEKRKEEEIKKEMEELLQEFAYSQLTVSSDYLNALLLDEASQTLLIANRENTDSGFEVRDYPFDKIYETSIEENDHPIALISRRGLFGGSLLEKRENSLINVTKKEKDSKNDMKEAEEEKEEKSKKDKDKEKDKEGIKKLCLKIVVDDLDDPIIEYVFLENEEPIDQDSDEYKDAFKLCKKWHQMISVLIKRYDLLDKVIISRYEDSNRVV